MAIRNIYLDGDPILRKKCRPVVKFDEKLSQILDDMHETLDKASGVGLAAPQVGKLLRMFVIIADDEIRRVFINPQIIATSQNLVPYEEGCLSIPKVYENIMRPEKITVNALNEKGKPFTLEADGLLARIIQHEYDHLEGMVFIDRGDPDFKKKTEESFERREKRRQEKAMQKQHKQQRIAAKKAKQDSEC